MKADTASKFAIESGLTIVSDLFGDYFVVGVPGTTERYRVARLSPKATKGAVLIGETFADLDNAIARAKALGGPEPTEPMASLTDQQVINRVLPSLGLKASGQSFHGNIVVSAPIQDRRRRWQVAKRIGASLCINDKEFPNKYASTVAAVKAAGDDTPTEHLSGPNVFPYGSNFATQVKVA